MVDPRSPDFVEAIARGFYVIKAFGSRTRRMSLSEVAEASGLARPTARRILITLGELGYVRTDGREFMLTPLVLELGTAYVTSSGIWEAAQSHLRELSHVTGESCSIAQLDGSDIVYIARVAVPKLVTLTVTIGTRFPAGSTSLGKVLLAALPRDELEIVLGIPSRSGITPAVPLDRAQLDDELRRVRAQGWAMTDQQLGPAIRSIAAPIRNGSGTVIAAANVNAHAAETSIETLTGDHLPHLLQAASAISADIALIEAVPAELMTPR